MDDQRTLEFWGVTDYAPKMLLEHNFWFLGTGGGGNHHSFRSSMNQSRL